CRFISRYHLNSFFLFVILSHFFCICVPAIRALHSFPTRRSSDLHTGGGPRPFHTMWLVSRTFVLLGSDVMETFGVPWFIAVRHLDRKSTRLNSSHVSISYAVFCLKKKTLLCCLTSLHSTHHVLSF